MNHLHIQLRFGPGIPAEVQGPLLLKLEKIIRADIGLRVELFKETMEDDSKLRRSMTLIQRASL